MAAVVAASAAAPVLAAAGSRIAALGWALLGVTVAVQVGIALWPADRGGRDMPV